MQGETRSLSSLPKPSTFQPMLILLSDCLPKTRLPPKQLGKQRRTRVPRVRLFALCRPRRGPTCLTAGHASRPGATPGHDARLGVDDRRRALQGASRRIERNKARDRRRSWKGRTGANPQSRLKPPDQENPLGQCTSSASFRSEPKTREQHHGHRHMTGRTNNGTDSGRPAVRILRHVGVFEQVEEGKVQVRSHNYILLGAT